MNLLWTLRNSHFTFWVYQQKRIENFYFVDMPNKRKWLSNSGWLSNFPFAFAFPLKSDFVSMNCLQIQTYRSNFSQNISIVYAFVRMFPKILATFFFALLQYLANGNPYFIHDFIERKNADRNILAQFFGKKFNFSLKCSQNVFFSFNILPCSILHCVQKHLNSFFLSPKLLM